MFLTEVKCKWKGKCSSEGIYCYDCEENTNNKKDYYKPNKKDYYKWTDDGLEWTLPFTVNTTDSTCALEAFFKDPQNKGKVANLYCGCPKCSPQCVTSTTYTISC